MKLFIYSILLADTHYTPEPVLFIGRGDELYFEGELFSISGLLVYLVRKLCLFRKLLQKILENEEVERQKNIPVYSARNASWLKIGYDG
jgi:hypothetical protein